jgi:heme exporter protein D
VLVSSFLLATWVDFYARDYGGFGVVMALFFWIGIAASIIVLVTSLSPGLAARRDLLRARAQPAN